MCSFRFSRTFLRALRRRLRKTKAPGSLAGRKSRSEEHTLNSSHLPYTTLFRSGEGTRLNVFFPIQPYIPAGPAPPTAEDKGARKSRGKKKQIGRAHSELQSLTLHDALPIWRGHAVECVLSDSAVHSCGPCAADCGRQRRQEVSREEKAGRVDAALRCGLWFDFRRDEDAALRSAQARLQPAFSERPGLRVLDPGVTARRQLFRTCLWFSGSPRRLRRPALPHCRCHRDWLSRSGRGHFRNRASQWEWGWRR